MQFRELSNLSQPVGARCGRDLLEIARGHGQLGDFVPTRLAEQHRKPAAITPKLKIGMEMRQPEIHLAQVCSKVAS
jgi:hypothetical protein